MSSRLAAAAPADDAPPADAGARDALLRALDAACVGAANAALAPLPTACGAPLCAAAAAASASAAAWPPRLGDARDVAPADGTACAGLASALRCAALDAGTLSAFAAAAGGATSPECALAALHAALHALAPPRAIKMQKQGPGGYESDVTDLTDDAASYDSDATGSPDDTGSLFGDLFAAAERDAALRGAAAAAAAYAATSCVAEAASAAAAAAERAAAPAAAALARAAAGALRASLPSEAGGALAVGDAAAFGDALRKAHALCAGTADAASALQAAAAALPEAAAMAVVEADLLYDSDDETTTVVDPGRHHKKTCFINNEKDNTSSPPAVSLGAALLLRDAALCARGASGAGSLVRGAWAAFACAARPAAPLGSRPGAGAALLLAWHALPADAAASALGAALQALSFQTGERGATAQLLAAVAHAARHSAPPAWLAAAAARAPDAAPDGLLCLPAAALVQTGPSRDDADTLLRTAALQAGLPGAGEDWAGALRDLCLDTAEASGWDDASSPSHAIADGPDQAVPPEALAARRAERAAASAAWALLCALPAPDDSACEPDEGTAPLRALWGLRGAGGTHLAAALRALARAPADAEQDEAAWAAAAAAASMRLLSGDVTDAAAVVAPLAACLRRADELAWRRLRAALPGTRAAAAAAVALARAAGPVTADATSAASSADSAAGARLATLLAAPMPPPLPAGAPPARWLPAPPATAAVTERVASARGALASLASAAAHIAALVPDKAAELRAALAGASSAARGHVAPTDGDEASVSPAFSTASCARAADALRAVAAMGAAAPVGAWDAASGAALCALKSASGDDAVPLLTSAAALATTLSRDERASAAAMRLLAAAPRDAAALALVAAPKGAAGAAASLAAALCHGGSSGSAASALLDALFREAVPAGAPPARRLLEALLAALPVLALEAPPGAAGALVAAAARAAAGVAGGAALLAAALASLPAAAQAALAGDDAARRAAAPHALAALAALLGAPASEATPRTAASAPHRSVRAVRAPVAGGSGDDSDSDAETSPSSDAASSATSSEAPAASPARRAPRLAGDWVPLRRGRANAAAASASAGSAPPATLQCTFATGGDAFLEQHWYYCYTCDLAGSRGCCSACARTCHAGHEVSYSRRSRFFCDCGAGAARGAPCARLEPVPAPQDHDADANAVQSGAPGAPNDAADAAVDAAAAAAAAAAVAASDEDDDGHDVTASVAVPGAAAAPSLAAASLPPAFVAELRASLAACGLAASLAVLADAACAAVRASATSAAAACDAAMATPTLAPADAAPSELVAPAASRAASAVGPPLLLRRSFRPGSFDVRPRAELAAPRDAQLLLATGALRRAPLSVSASGFLAVAEGDKVCILHAAAIAGLGGPGAVTVPGAAPAASATPGASAPAALPNNNAGGGESRPGVRPVSRASVKFEVLRVAFCAADASRLLVAGATVAQAWTLTAGGDVADRTPLGAAVVPDGDSYAAAVAAADGSGGSSSCGGVILAATWLPGSRCRVALATSAALRVFDASRPASCAGNAVLALAPPAGAGAIADACIAQREDAAPLALALTDAGRLLASPLPRGDAASECRSRDAEPVPFAVEIQLPSELSGRGGLSLHFSLASRLLLASLDGGATLAARLCGDDVAPVRAWAVLREGADASQEGPTGFSRLGDALPLPPPGVEAPPDGLLLALAARTGGVVALSLRGDTATASALRGATSTAAASAASPPAPPPRAEGWAGYRPAADATSAEAFVFVLYDDGALHAYAKQLPPALPGAHRRAAAAASAAAMAASATAASAAAALAAAPASVTSAGVALDFFERALHVTQRAMLRGSLVRPGGSGAALASLLADGLHLEAPAPGSGTLVASLDQAASADDVAIVALRVNCAASPAAPRSVTLPGGRVVPFRRAARRWYDIVLTAAECAAVASAGNALSLEFGAAAGDASLPMRIDGIELYALPRAAVAARTSADESGRAAAEAAAQAAAEAAVSARAAAAAARAAAAAMPPADPRGPHAASALLGVSLRALAPALSAEPGAADAARDVALAVLAPGGAWAPSRDARAAATATLHAACGDDAAPAAADTARLAALRVALQLDTSQPLAPSAGATLAAAMRSAAGLARRSALPCDTLAAAAALAPAAAHAAGTSLSPTELAAPLAAAMGTLAAAGAEHAASAADSALLLLTCSHAGLASAFAARLAADAALGAAVEEAPPAQEAPPALVFTCDACGATPLRVRFRCADARCADLDLCADCHADGAVPDDKPPHDQSHQILDHPIEVPDPSIPVAPATPVPAAPRPLPPLLAPLLRRAGGALAAAAVCGDAACAKRLASLLRSLLGACADGEALVPMRDAARDAASSLGAALAEASGRAVAVANDARASSALAAAAEAARVALRFSRARGGSDAHALCTQGSMDVLASIAAAAAERLRLRDAACPLSSDAASEPPHGPGGVLGWCAALPGDNGHAGGSCADGEAAAAALLAAALRLAAAALRRGAPAPAADVATPALCHVIMAAARDAKRDAPPGLVPAPAAEAPAVPPEASPQQPHRPTGAAAVAQQWPFPAVPPPQPRPRQVRAAAGRSARALLRACAGSRAAAEAAVAVARCSARLARADDLAATGDAAGSRAALVAAAESAAAAPAAWRAAALAGDAASLPARLATLLAAAYAAGPEAPAAAAALRLVALSFRPVQQSTAPSAGGNSSEDTDADDAGATWLLSSAAEPARLVRVFVLGAPSAAARDAAADVLRGTLAAAGGASCASPAAARIVACVFDHAHLAAPYGAASAPLLSLTAEALTSLGAAGTTAATSSPQADALLPRLAAALRSAGACASRAPHGALYAALRGCTALDAAHGGGYWLEPHAPGAALGDASGGPTSNATSAAWFRLEAVRAEGKFASRDVFARLAQPALLAGFSVTVSEPRAARGAALLSLYVADARGSLAAQRGDASAWRKAASLALQPGQRSAVLRLPEAVPASAVRFCFERLQCALGAAASEALACPRCSRAVSDPRGVCRGCRENAWQCRACRNICYGKRPVFAMAARSPVLTQPRYPFGRSQRTVPPFSATSAARAATRASTSASCSSARHRHNRAGRPRRSTSPPPCAARTMRALRPWKRTPLRWQRARRKLLSPRSRRASSAWLPLRAASAHSQRRMVTQ